MRFMDFSQNSMVVIDFIVNQMWKQKKSVDKSAKKVARVSPNSNINILPKGVSEPVAFLTESRMVKLIVLVAMTEYRRSRKKYLWLPKPTQL